MGTHYFASHKGGIEIVAEQLFRQFAAGGHEVVWMAGDDTPPPDAHGNSRTRSLPVFNFIEKKIGLPCPIPTVSALKAIRAEVKNADVLIIHDCLYLSNIAAFLVARVRRIDTIVVQHIGFVPYRNWILNTLMKIANVAITRPMLARAGQVVFISDTTRRFFTGLRFRRLPQTIFNGVDTESYRTLFPRERKVDVRVKYKLPPDRPAILFVGRFVEKKGMAALRRMASRRVDLTWVFAGWGPIDPNEWNAPNVRVLSGLRGESLGELYRACDIFVLPSTGEGFPLVIQEALASGLPVVCSSETVVADPEMAAFATGVPVYVGNDERTAEEFLAAIENVLAGEPFTQKGPAERHAFAVRRYSWRSAAEQYLEIASALRLRNFAERHSGSAGEKASR